MVDSLEGPETENTVAFAQAQMKGSLELGRESRDLFHDNGPTSEPHIRVGGNCSPG